MDAIAPLRWAEAWDNVGLIVGDPAAVAARVLLCIDLTSAVLAEAVSLRCDAVVAYHPPIFDGLKKLAAGEIAFEAARRGIAVYSPHTALDVATGGTNDVLAELVGIQNTQPLKPAAAKARHCKLVTFAPHAAAEAVAEALFEAGAGRIGEYEKCSFRSEGTGTFLGSAGTRPAVGKAGAFERAPEVRIEVVVPLSRVDAAVAALRASHPYGEPAFDLLSLLAVPEGMGIGRVGDVGPVTLGEVADRLKGALGLSAVLVAGAGDLEISRVAVCAGAGRSLVGEVIASGAECYVTGELPHHDALRLVKAGVGVVCTLHSNSERPVLGHVAKRLSARGFTTVVSERDRDPFEGG